MREGKTRHYQGQHLIRVTGRGAEQAKRVGRYGGKVWGTGGGAVRDTLAGKPVARRESQGRTWKVFSAGPNQ